MTSTGRIIIRRSSSPWRDRAVAYRIDIDGLEVGHVRDGEQVEYQVEPGQHVVRAVVSFNGSPPLAVHVVEGEPTNLTVEPAGPASAAIFQVFRRNGWLRLSVDRAPQ